MPELVQGRAWKQVVGNEEKEEQKEGLENGPCSSHGSDQVSQAA